MRALLALLLCVLATAAEPALTPELWAERLHEIDARLVAGDQRRAIALAEELAARSVVWPDGPGAADPGLLAAIRRGTGRRRIAEALAAVQAGAPAAQAVDAARLSGLEASRRSRVLAAGGEVEGLQGLDLPESAWLSSIGETLLDWVRSAMDWLRRLFGRDRAGDEGGLGAVWAWIAAGLGLALVAAVAVAALRRRPLPAEPAVVAGGAHEALARPSDAWFDEAARLIAAGQARQAVRAAYLGLLAATWERGLLHHRTGWTNWDYVNAAPPAWSGRGDFAELTRRFDRVWYGDLADPSGPEDYRQRVREVVARLRQERPR